MSKTEILVNNLLNHARYLDSYRGATRIELEMAKTMREAAETIHKSQKAWQKLHIISNIKALEEGE